MVIYYAVPPQKNTTSITRKNNNKPANKNIKPDTSLKTTFKNIIIKKIFNLKHLNNLG